MQEAMIKICGVRKVYRIGTEKVIALDRIDADIQKGEICCIFGTSSFQARVHFEPACRHGKTHRGKNCDRQRGYYKTAGGKDGSLQAETHRIYFPVLQSAAIYDCSGKYSAASHVPGVWEEGERSRAARLLKMVGLGERLSHYPSQMSGGQQQRVGIARAFAANPDVIFADEPTGNLDTKTTAQIMEMVLAFARENRQTIVLVTHDPEMASYADRILTLIDGNIVKDERKDKK